MLPTLLKTALYCCVFAPPLSLTKRTGQTGVFVAVGVLVCVGVLVTVAVLVNVGVRVLVGVGVLVRVAVAVGDGPGVMV
jgi:hypothetical protein